MRLSTETSEPNSKLNSLKNLFSDYLKNIKLFSKNARLYLLGSFLIGVNFHVFNLLLNLYLKEYGFVEGDIGMVISARAVGMTMIALPVAMLLSRIRLKPILIASSILFAIFSYFITNSQQLIFLIGASLLAGMSFSFYRVAAAPFYMRNSTPTERTHLFSISFGMMNLSAMVGSLGSGKLVIFLGELTGDIILGYQYTMYLGILIGLLSLIPFMVIKSSKPSVEENKIIFSKAQLKKRGSFYFKVTISNFLVGAGAGLVIPFLNLYFKDRFNLTPDLIGFYYFIVQLSMLFGSLSGPVLVKKYGLVRTVVFTQLASIPFMLMLSYTYFLPLAFIAFVLRGGLMNLGVPIVTNLGMELSDKKEQGLVNALLMVAWTSAWMVSAAIGGELIEKYGYTFTMNITVFSYVLSSVAFFLFFRKVETKTAGSPRWVISRESLS